MRVKQIIQHPTLDITIHVKENDSIDLEIDADFTRFDAESIRELGQWFIDQSSLIKT